MFFSRTPFLQTAFQPIVRATAAGVALYGYEALARGRDGRVPKRLTAKPSRALYKLDWQCRRCALKDAVDLQIRHSLSLNITPGAICHPVYGIQRTLDDAKDLGFPASQIVFEITEFEPVLDYRPLRQCIDQSRQDGVKLSLDDFGTGFNSLNTVIELRPDIVKLDMSLVQKIEQDEGRQAMMYAVREGSVRFQNTLIAEGIEQLDTAAALSAFGIDLMQGYLFARPALGHLPRIEPSVDESVRHALSGALAPMI